MMEQTVGKIGILGIEIPTSFFLVYNQTVTDLYNKLKDIKYKVLYFA